MVILTIDLSSEEGLRLTDEGGEDPLSGRAVESEEVEGGAAGESNTGKAKGLRKSGGAVV